MNAQLRNSCGRRLVTIATMLFLACNISPLVARQTTKEQPVATNTQALSQGCVPDLPPLKTRASQLTLESSDAMVVLRALDKEAGVPDFNNRNIAMPLLSSDSILVLLSPPYWDFRFNIGEAIRKREPIADVQVKYGVVITVMPMQIGAPDIDKVIVERDGVLVTQAINQIRPQEFTTQIGAKAIVHAGFIVYPCAVFTPGGTVTVTVIPAVGRNTVRTFSQRELSAITGQPSEAIEVPNDLVGLSQERILALLGEPSEKEGQWWTYKAVGTISLTIHWVDGKVKSAEPDDFQLSRLRREK